MRLTITFFDPIRSICINRHPTFSGWLIWANYRYIRLKKNLSQSCRTHLFYGARLIQQNSWFELFLLVSFFFQFLWTFLSKYTWKDITHTIKHFEPVLELSPDSWVRQWSSESTRPESESESESIRCESESIGPESESESESLDQSPSPVGQSPSPSPQSPTKVRVSPDIESGLSLVSWVHQ